MKLSHCISVFAVSLFLSSSISGISNSLEIGKEAPGLELSAAGDSTLSLESLRGRHILVNFWSASYPASRIANLHYSRLASAISTEKLAFISINVDSDEQLARQIMQLDGTESPLSFTISSLKTGSLENYQTESGCRSFLIDPLGNLKAILTSEDCDILAALS